MDGCFVEIVEGRKEGTKLGLELSVCDGADVEMADGKTLGVMDGCFVEIVEGRKEGTELGLELSVCDGADVEMADGKTLGLKLGLSEGYDVGLIASLGASVSKLWFRIAVGASV